MSVTNSTNHYGASSVSLQSSAPFIAAVPSLLALMATAVVLVILAAGGRSVWLDTDMSPAEAALTGDVGRLYRLLAAGHSPLARYPIRRKYRSDPTHTMLRPSEAAVIGGDRAVIALLLERIPQTDALPCSATSDNKDVETLLRRHGVSKNDLRCP